MELKRHHLGLGLVLLVATFLRLLHLNWGLPLIEEEAYPLYRALKMSGWATGGASLNPETAGWPSLSFYLNMAIQQVHYLVGGFEDPVAYWNAFTEDKTTLAILSRGSGALISVFAVWITWRLGYRLAGVWGALIASGLLALNPLTLRYAQEISPEMLVLVSSAFCLWYLVRIREDGQLRDYLWFGLAMGLGVSAKYTPGLFLPALLLVHLQRRREEGLGLHFAGFNDKRLLLSGAVAALSFAVTSPYLVIDPGSLKEGLSDQAIHMTQGHLGEGGNGPAFAFYFLRVLAPAFGWPATIVSLLGLAWCAWTKRGPWLTVVIALVSYMSVVGFFATRFDRYLFPALPALAMGAAGFLLMVGAGIKRERGLPPIVASAVLGLCLAPPAYGAYQYHQRISSPSTAAAASAWVESNAASGSMIAVEFQTLPFYAQQIEKKNYFALFLPLNTDAPETSAPFYDLRWYDDFQFIVVGAGVGDRYRADPSRFSKQVAFYHALESRWRRAASFDDENYRGPDIVIYGNKGEKSPGALDPLLFDGLKTANPVLRRRFLGELGDTYANAGRFPEAAWVYEQFRNLCPDCPEPYERMTVVALMTGKYDLAATVSRNYLERKPEDHEMRLNLAFALEHGGQLEEALEEVKRILSVVPDHPVARGYHDELLRKQP